MIAYCVSSAHLTKEMNPNKHKLSHDHRSGLLLPHYNVPKDLFLYTQMRQCLGPVHPRGQRVASNYLARQLPSLLQEKEYSLGTINKIFASEWVSDRQVVIGTKCNKLIVLDLETSQLANIPQLKSSAVSVPADCPCGIHSIAVNPSRNLLATGAENTNDLAIYSLPTLDPIGTGEQGHTDWIFDIKWLDDQFLVTGSRDSTLALWKVKDDLPVYRGEPSVSSVLPVTSSCNVTPVVKKKCKKAEKVRALAYHKSGQEVAALSLNAHLHTWDLNTFQQKFTRKLNHPRENVCLTVSEKHHLYAVGSQSSVSMIDTRTLKNSIYITSKHRGCGIRSVSFNEDIVTFGTGNGMIFFFDVRANAYLDMNCGHSCTLNVGKGYLLHDETYEYFFVDHEYPNAVYTHSYDPSGTKLFTAGGPLPAGLHGNYAALWQ